RSGTPGSEFQFLEIIVVPPEPFEQDSIEQFVEQPDQNQYKTGEHHRYGNDHGPKCNGIDFLGSGLHNLFALGRIQQYPVQIGYGTGGKYDQIEPNVLGDGPLYLEDGHHQLSGRIRDGYLFVVDVKLTDEIKDDRIIENIQTDDHLVDVQGLELHDGLRIVEQNIDARPKHKLDDADQKDPLHQGGGFFPDHFINIIIGELGKFSFPFLPISLQ